jgi:tetratricopeptide (TPR) repeat protein
MRPNRFGLLIAVLAGTVAGGSVIPNRTAAAQADAAKPSIQERLDRVRADIFSRADHVDAGIHELKTILGIDPRSAEAHLLLGIAYRIAGSPELMGESVAELRQALALNPDLTAAHFYLARIYLDLGRAARAREELESALVQVPGNAQFMALLGEAERQLKNPGRSVELTRQALQGDESFAEARYYLGLALFDLGRRDEAIKELERVVLSHPKVADAYFSLGNLYLDAGRFDEALATLTEGTRVDPSRPDLRIQMARAYREKGLLAKADAQLTLAMPRATASLASPLAQYQQLELDFYLEQGFLRLQQARREAAARALQKALAIDPNDARTRLLQEKLRKVKTEDRQ